MFFTRRFLSRCKCQSKMVAFKGIWTKKFWRAVSGEYVATFIFVLLGIGSTINWGAKEEKPPPADLVLISLGFGLTIATMVQCFGHISGGHINPAVTAAMVVTRKISLAKSLFYVLAQCLGAVTGAGILYLVTPADFRGNLGVTTVSSTISIGHAFLVELIITFELVFTIFATCDPNRTDLGGSAGLAIGFAVAIGHLFAIPYTGASMNPARSFGPALVTLNFENHWVYWVGPILGSVLAAGLYEYLYCPDPGIKKRLKQVFQKDMSGRYKEVDVGEAEDLTFKPGSVHAIDQEKAERKDPFQKFTGEVLSSA
ncbi:aquaporin-4-like isoform X2 [Thalassophryne amazonica]|uniref:aquaporin-4-like isoform X2 n=1 Tax=Thalassophryne amazonica TaxID=390379 RepID=UPI0014726AF0|nr:aquaporin-4-like isoform X2 [Thalassophryne amazonica]